MRPPRDSKYLAAQLIYLIKNDPLTDCFVEKNLKLIQQKVDGDVVCESIKSLVDDIAQKSQRVRSYT